MIEVEQRRKGGGAFDDWQVGQGRSQEPTATTDLDSASRTCNPSSFSEPSAARTNERDVFLLTPSIQNLQHILFSSLQFSVPLLNALHHPSLVISPSVTTTHKLCPALTSAQRRNRHT
jgi:hypothetical protein